MSRTHHHSLHWGRSHRFADRDDRGYGMSKRGIGEAPSWHVRLYDNRPGRFDDRAVLRLVKKDVIEGDAAVFNRSGGRKPHSYFW